jgi:hypothetical protein
VLRNQDISVAKAKKAISDYKKAIGRPEGLTELAVFYCEECAVFLGLCGMDDEGYFSALVRMFEQALRGVSGLPADQHEPFLARLDDVHLKSLHFGYGVDEEMDALLAEYGFGGE